MATLTYDRNMTTVSSLRLIVDVSSHADMMYNFAHREKWKEGRRMPCWEAVWQSVTMMEADFSLCSGLAAIEDSRLFARSARRWQGLSRGETEEDCKELFLQFNSLQCVLFSLAHPESCVDTKIDCGVADVWTFTQRWAFDENAYRPGRAFTLHSHRLNIWHRVPGRAFRPLHAFIVDSGKHVWCWCEYSSDLPSPGSTNSTI